MFKEFTKYFLFLFVFVSVLGFILGALPLDCKDYSDTTVQELYSNLGQTIHESITGNCNDVSDCKTLSGLGLNKLITNGTKKQIINLGSASCILNDFDDPSKICLYSYEICDVNSDSVYITQEGLLNNDNLDILKSQIEDYDLLGFVPVGIKSYINECNSGSFESTDWAYICNYEQYSGYSPGKTLSYYWPYEYVSDSISICSWGLEGDPLWNILQCNTINPDLKFSFDTDLYACYIDKYYITSDGVGSASEINKSIADNTKLINIVQPSYNPSECKKYSFFCNPKSDNNSCTKDICSEETWTTTYQKLNGQQPGCTGTSTCIDGECKPTPCFNACDDGNPCTIDNCQFGSVCTHNNLPINTPCNNGGQCSPIGECKNELPSMCRIANDDGNYVVCDIDTISIDFDLDPNGTGNIIDMNKLRTNGQISKDKLVFDVNYGIFDNVINLHNNINYPLDLTLTRSSLGRHITGLNLDYNDSKDYDLSLNTYSGYWEINNAENPIILKKLNANISLISINPDYVTGYNKLILNSNSTLSNSKLIVKYLDLGGVLNLTNNSLLGDDNSEIHITQINKSGMVSWSGLSDNNLIRTFYLKSNLKESYGMMSLSNLDGNIRFNIYPLDTNLSVVDYSYLITVWNSKPKSLILNFVYDPLISDPKDMHNLLYVKLSSNIVINGPDFNGVDFLTMNSDVPHYLDSPQNNIYMFMIDSQNNNINISNFKYYSESNGGLKFGIPIITRSPITLTNSIINNAKSAIKIENSNNDLNKYWIFGNSFGYNGNVLDISDNLNVFGYLYSNFFVLNNSIISTNKDQDIILSSYGDESNGPKECDKYSSILTPMPIAYFNENLNLIMQTYLPKCNGGNLYYEKQIELGCNKDCFVDGNDNDSVSEVFYTVFKNRFDFAPLIYSVSQLISYNDLEFENLNKVYESNETVDINLVLNKNIYVNSDITSVEFLFYDSKDNLLKSFMNSYNAFNQPIPGSINFKVPLNKNISDLNLIGNNIKIKAIVNTNNRLTFVQETYILEDNFALLKVVKTPDNSLYVVLGLMVVIIGLYVYRTKK